MATKKAGRTSARIGGPRDPKGVSGRMVEGPTRSTSIGKFGGKGGHGNTSISKQPSLPRNLRAKKGKGGAGAGGSGG